VTLRELRTELIRRRVRDTSYVFDGVTSRDAAEGAFYVARTDTGWKVGVQERGARDAYDSFADEDTACRFALEILDRPSSRAARPWWLRWL
jgi:hypothetical protein